MAGLQEGMVCVKTKGREAGKKVVIVEFDRKTGTAVIDGPAVKKKRCNVKHLLPTGKSVAIKKRLTKKQLAELLKE